MEYTIYTVECVRLKQDKIGKCTATFVSDCPRKAIETFIELYLIPVDEPDVYYGGLDWVTNKFLSYKITLKDVPDTMFFLNCKYEGEKNKYAKTLP